MTDTSDRTWIQAMQRAFADPTQEVNLTHEWFMRLTNVALRAAPAADPVGRICAPSVALPYKHFERLREPRDDEVGMFLYATINGPAACKALPVSADTDIGAGSGAAPIEGLNDALGDVRREAVRSRNSSNYDDSALFGAIDAAARAYQEAAAELAELKREVWYLRQYGNKDCTAQADLALAASTPAKDAT